MAMDENSSVAQRFFAAAAQGDADQLRALCAPGFEARRNGGPPAGIDALIAVSAAIRAVAPDFRYEHAVRSATATGFVEEHEVRCTLPDGTPLHLSVCVVGEVVAGKVSALREYLDTAAAARLGKALHGR